MSITHKWIGHTTTTTSRVGARSDADGDITLTVNGTTYTETAATATNDGIVVFDVAGLSPGRRYTATFNDGSTVSIPTLPESGPYRIIVCSCVRPDWPQNALKLAMDQDPHVVVFLGDLWYDDVPVNTYGENFVGTSTSLANSQDIANYYMGHRQGRSIPFLRRLMERYPLLYMPDDHERGWNDSVYNLNSFQAKVTGAGSATQEQFETARDNGLMAAKAWMQTNPDGPGTDALHELFFSFTLPDGSAEIFVTDNISQRGQLSATDNESKSMLGSDQKAWLKDAVLESTAPNKLILSPKQYWEGGSNADTWVAQGANQGYQTELKELLAYWATVTGLSTHAGDQHSPNVQYVAADELGVTHAAHLCVVACPLGMTIFNHDSTDTRLKWWYGNNDSLKTPSPFRTCVFELITVYEDKINAKIISTVKGVVWEGEVAATGTTVSNPNAGKIAVA